MGVAISMGITNKTKVPLKESLQGRYKAKVTVFLIEAKRGVLP
jgi:hypothetical protein